MKSLLRTVGSHLMEFGSTVENHSRLEFILGNMHLEFERFTAFGVRIGDFIYEAGVTVHNLGCD